MSKKNSKLNPKRQKVVFSIDDLEAKEVFLAGDFNAWKAKKHPLKKDANGFWKKSTFLFPGRYEYKFFVDGSWVLDPKNHQVCANIYGTLNNAITISAG